MKTELNIRVTSVRHRMTKLNCLLGVHKRTYKKLCNFSSLQRAKKRDAEVLKEMHSTEFLLSISPKLWTFPFIGMLACVDLYAFLRIRPMYLLSFDISSFLNEYL